MAINVDVQIYGDLDRNFEKGFRKFKRILDKEGVLAQCKKISFYVKPSDLRREKIREAKKKQRKNKKRKEVGYF